jgi:hypothetical protein
MNFGGGVLSLAHYLIYNIENESFLQISANEGGDIIAHHLVSEEWATVFTFHEKNFVGFETDEFIISAVNYLNIHDELKNYLFCSCKFSYTANGAEILGIDFIYPLLNCSLLSERIGENLVYTGDSLI